MRRIFLLSLLLGSLIAERTSMFSRENPSQNYKAGEKAQYTIVGKYQRSNDQLFFTEGLSFIDENTLLESTGLYGDSEIHFIQNFDKPQTSTIKNRHQFEKKYFGEGSTRIKTSQGIEHYMMTYKERTIFVLDESLTDVKRQYAMPAPITEGWGMTSFIDTTGKQMLLVSDGTNRLFHVDPDGFKISKVVNMFDFDSMPLDQVNELESYKDGTVLANIWNTNKVAKINIADGKLLQIYSFQGLIDDLESEKKYANYCDPFFGSVLNGIAYHHQSERLVLGGKKWPYWYEVDLHEE